MTAGVPLEFVAHPEALRELRQLPSWVRDSAHLTLQQLVLLRQRGPQLEQELAGTGQRCREVHLGPGGDWRAVYQERPSADHGGHAVLYLLAVGARADPAVLTSVAQRLAVAATSGREDAVVSRSVLDPARGESIAEPAPRSPTPPAEPARRL